MTHAPHLVVEGMILAGLVAGRAAGHSLHPARVRREQEHILDAEIQRCSPRVCSARILGTDLAFDLEVFVSPGGYICGEETRCSKPSKAGGPSRGTNRPFPCQQGLWRRPTVINNVETFFFVPRHPR